MANVPPHQDFKHKVHAKAYKTAERNGLVWVFMGDQANVPALPQKAVEFRKHAVSNHRSGEISAKWVLKKLKREPGASLFFLI